MQNNLNKKGALYMAIFSPHELKKLLKRYGIEVEELRGVDKVEFFIGSKRIIVTSPQVILLRAPGQLIYQVVGSEVREEPVVQPVTKPEITVSEDDIKFVMENTGVARDKAVEALVKAKGDIARAIMILRGESSE